MIQIAHKVVSYSKQSFNNTTDSIQLQLHYKSNKSFDNKQIIAIKQEYTFSKKQNYFKIENRSFTKFRNIQINLLTS